jgi:hypothetical protein
VLFVALFVGVFLAVVLAFMCTEYVLVFFDARRSVLVGEGSSLLVILGAHAASFTLVWLSAVIFVFASGAGVYTEATVVALCAQGVWLTQHLWSYYRDHLRLRYEN